MSDETTTTVETGQPAPSAAGSDVAAPDAGGGSETPPSAPAAEAEGGDATQEGAETAPSDGDGEKQPKPTVDKLTAWSQKLSRRKHRLDAREGRVSEREQQLSQREARANELEALLDSDPAELLEVIAKRRGKSRSEVYQDWMRREIQADAPMTRAEFERMERERTERSAAEQKQREESQRAEAEKTAQAQEAAFTPQANLYIRQELGTDKYPHLSAYDHNTVVNLAVGHVIRTFRQSGKELPLDEVLRDMETATRADYERMHAKRSAQAPHSERGNGAAPAAQPEARRRTVTNNDAAQRATQPDADEDLSDQALRSRAADVLRRANSGWR